MSDNDRPDPDLVEWIVFITTFLTIGYLVFGYKIWWTLQVISIFK